MVLLHLQLQLECSDRLRSKRMLLARLAPNGWHNDLTVTEATKNLSITCELIPRDTHGPRT